MHAAQVLNWGEAPKYVEVETAPAPASDSDLVHIKVTAAGIHQLVRLRASGNHYTSKTLPHVPGVDGTGIEVATGKPVYFFTLNVIPEGSFAEYINVPRKFVVPIPETANHVTVAALTNPALASYMGLKTRTDNLPANFSIAILGVTGLSGVTAIHIARALGASRVIGIARSPAKMAQLPLDESIAMADPVDKTDFSSLATNPPDVILDFLYGSVTETLLQALKPGHRIQYIQVGSLGGNDIKLNFAPLRSINLTMRGSGPGSWTMEELAKELPGMVTAVSKLEEPKIYKAKLADIEQAWTVKSERTVIEF